MAFEINTAWTITAALLGTSCTAASVSTRRKCADKKTLSTRLATIPSAVVEPWAAAVIGAVSGLVTVAALPLWERLRIDDPTEYLTMNLIGRLLGVIAVGLLVSPEIVNQYATKPIPRPGLFYGGGSVQLLSQLWTAAAIVGFALPVMLAACALLRALGWLRVHPQEERQGSDRVTHGEKAYE